jgi:hypothetical protein
MRECRLDVDAADLDTALFSSTRAVAIRTCAMAASTWRRIGLLKTCQRCAQVGLGAVERQQTHLFKLETRVVGTRGYRLALLLCSSLGAVCVGLDPTCVLGIGRADSRWVIR